MNGESKNENSEIKVTPKNGKTRAGFTKNHGLGIKKSVRNMVKASQRKNRGKK